MKKIIIIIDLTVILMLSGCDRSGNHSTTETQIIFDRAEMNGRLSNEGFNRCMKYVNGWLSLADPATGLIPRNINDKPSKDIWNAKDCAADNYPFMVLTAALLDTGLFNGRMREMLDTETRLHFSTPASRNAISNDCRYSLCLPTPFVKKTFFGIIVLILLKKTKLKK